MTRFGTVLAMSVASLALVAPGLAPVTPRLVWNASSSVPVGLYAVRPTEHLAVSDLVAIAPPEPLARFLSERRYLQRDTPLMKRVAALPGQDVCRTGGAVTVDGRPLGTALDRDRIGRPLPVWQGCRRVADGDLFLMNASVPDSLDGRYFGPLPGRSVLGRAIPILTDEAGDGRFVWRAPPR